MSLGTQRHGDEDAEREVVEGVPQWWVGRSPRGCDATCRPARRVRRMPGESHGHIGKLCVVATTAAASVVPALVTVLLSGAGDCVALWTRPGSK